MSSISTILTRWNGWNEEALQCAFLRSLNKQVKDELGLKDESDSLDTLVSLAIRLDNCMREKRRQRASHSPCLCSTSSTPPLIRQPCLGASAWPPGSCPLPLAQRRGHETGPGPAPKPSLKHVRWFKAGECIYRGNLGHFLPTCPLQRKGEAHQ